MRATKETLVAMPNASAARRRDEEEIEARDATSERKNRGFVQVYQLGWKRLQTLMKTNPNAARLYALLAENLDGCGAVIATQEVLGELLGVSKRTIIRHSEALENAKALVRIPIQGGVYAYALNPEEVWRAYDSGKEHAAFYTKTLVKARGKEAELVKRRLQVLIREQRGEPELPFEEVADPDE